MNILVLNYEFPPLGGGGAPFAHGLAVELARQGHSIDVITSRYKGFPPREDGAIRIFRVPVLRRHLGFSNPFEMATYILSGTWAAIRLCRSKPYDVIHSHFIIPSSVIAWVLKKIYGIPVVITAHGSDVPGYDPELSVILFHKALRWLWLAVVRSSSAIICPSGYIETLLKQAASNLKTYSIPYGAVPRSLVTTQRKKRILVVSRFFKRKGIDVFLESIAAAFDKGWDIVIMGDGPQKNELEEIAKQTPANIRFAGWIDREADAYKQYFEEASVFVFLSTSENFPVVLLDAMEHGLVVLASDIPGNHDVLGDTAVYVPATNKMEIQAQLRVLMNDAVLRENLGARSRRRLEENFTWPVIAKRYSRMFDEVLNESKH